ncbi:MAG: hypothetical protein IKC27_09750 [Kiritimatiellae bacterium]|nr:hypothetical protein [Kiritimatiellia bacterium]
MRPLSALSFRSPLQFNPTTGRWIFHYVPCAHVYRVMGEAVAKAFSYGREIGH